VGTERESTGPAPPETVELWIRAVKRFDREILEPFVRRTVGDAGAGVPQSAGGTAGGAGRAVAADSIQEAPRVA